MNALLDGRTVVAIAHRLHTAHDADRIAVVIDGEIVELGSHRRAGRPGRRVRRPLARLDQLTRHLFTPSTRHGTSHAYDADPAQVGAGRRRERRVRGRLTPTERSDFCRVAYWRALRARSA